MYRKFLAMVVSVVCLGSQMSPAAVVEVNVVGLDPLILIEGEDPGNWRWMPDFIRGSDVYSAYAGLPSGTVEGGSSPTT